MQFLNLFVLLLLVLTLSIRAACQDKGSAAEKRGFVTLRQGEGADPVLLIPGGDIGATQAAVNFLSTGKEAKRQFEMFVYPGAGHGHAQPLFNEGKNYNPEAVRITWVIVEDALSSDLRP
jgi:hypothetical protein